MTRTRPTICTASGIEFHPLDPRLEDIRLFDIAHALSHVPRFAGHTRDFYSVAQHCVHIVDILRDAGASLEAQQLGLLHDASEAYLGDVPGPLKHTDVYRLYRQAEDVLQEVIYHVFGLSESDLEEWEHPLKVADGMALAAEQVALMPDCDWWAKPTAPALSIIPWPSELARDRFLREAAALGLLG